MTKNNSNFPRGVEVVVGVVIKNNKGEILLTRSPKWSNKWTIPGGHIEPGETITKAALREAKEETGLGCKFVNVFTHGEMINPPEFHRPAHFIFFTAYCLSTGTDLKLDGKELNEHIWVSPEAALKYDFRRGFGDTLEEFIKYKKSLK